MGGCHPDERLESVSVFVGFSLPFDQQHFLLDQEQPGLFLLMTFGVHDGVGRERIRSRNNLFDSLDAG